MQSNSETGQVIEQSQFFQLAQSRAARTIHEIFASGRPLTYIRSTEEKRVTRVLREVGLGLLSSAAVPVWTWTLTEGMNRDGQSAEEGTETPRAALDFIVAHKDPAIFQLKDFHEPLRESAEIRRRLRDVYESCRDQQKFVVITSPVRYIPEELERSVLFLELRPPELVELTAFLREEDNKRRRQQRRLFCINWRGALQGLTLDEARYALRRALAASRTLGWSRCRPCSKRSACWSIAAASSNTLPTVRDSAEVGGLEGLKKWLLERRKLFQMRDS